MTSSENTKPSTENPFLDSSFVRYIRERQRERDEVDAQVQQASREYVLRNDYLEARNQQVRDYSKLRNTYGKLVYRYLTWYSIVVAVFVFLSGCAWFGFALPSEVLIALVSSTAVSVISVVGFVVRGLFRTPPLLVENTPEGPSA